MIDKYSCKVLHLHFKQDKEDMQFICNGHANMHTMSKKSYNKVGYKYTAKDHGQFC